MKNKIVLIIGICFSIISLTLVIVPKSSSATSGSQLYQGTTCNGPDSSWRCNNCIVGLTTCYDHSCWECYNPSVGE